MKPSRTDGNDSRLGGDKQKIKYGLVWLCQEQPPPVARRSQIRKKKCASHSKLGQICMCRASPWWLSFLHVFEKNNNNKKQNQDKNVDNKIQALSQREPSPCSMSSPRFRATPPPAGPLAPVHQNSERCTQRDRIWRLLLGVCHG
jgi:hypothetical protein